MDGSPYRQVAEEEWELCSSSGSGSALETLKRWRQAALVVNASRRFRYSLDLKREEEKQQIRQKIRAHARALSAALLFRFREAVEIEAPAVINSPHLQVWKDAIGSTIVVKGADAVGSAPFIAPAAVGLRGLGFRKAPPADQWAAHRGLGLPVTADRMEEAASADAKSGYDVQLDSGYYLYGDDDERSKGNWKLINEGLVPDIGPGGTAKHLKGISTASLPYAGMGPDMEPFKCTIAMDNAQIFMEASNWTATIDHQVLVKDYRNPTIINVKACGWGATIDSHVLTGANWDAILDHAQVVKEACGFGTALCGQVVMKASWCATIDHAQVLMEAHDFGTTGDWVGPCNVQFLLEIGQGSATSKLMNGMLDWGKVQAMTGALPMDHGLHNPANLCPTFGGEGWEAAKFLSPYEAIAAY